MNLSVPTLRTVRASLTARLVGMLAIMATISVMADDWAGQEWRQSTGAYGDRWAVVPDAGGYLFVVAANTLASPQSKSTLRLVVEDISAGAAWISDGPVALQVDSNRSVLFPDCAMNPSMGRFGSDPVDLFCVSTRDKVVMEIRDGAREDAFLRQLKAGGALKVMFAGTDGTANVLSFSLRKSGDTIAAVLEPESAAPVADSGP